MYGTHTPRLRSAFPSTPQSTPPSQRQYDEYRGSRPLPAQPVKQPVQSSSADSTQPLIPFELIDAPTQRLLIVAGYGILTALRLVDYWKVSDDLDSTWLFLKWVSIDFTALFILPTFRIPWLEWGFSTTLTAFLLHAVMNVFLMFHIPIPVGAWLAALVKIAYDRELAISERRVNPSDIIHNASLILGKQIIQILPEGSAVLNPDRIPLCLDATTTSIDLPIRINQTSPILMELLRIDPETQETELITINAKTARQMKRQADKLHSKSDTSSPRTLHFPTKKTGVYQLQRVVDESKLEVQKRAFDTVVPSCPEASIIADTTDKCAGDVSDLLLKVSGLPPFKVKYSKAINNHESSSHFQTIQPEDLLSPLNMQQPSSTLVDARNPQVDWAKPVEVSVPINELMGTTGTWSYTVEEVQDASGNIVVYKIDHESSKSRRALAKGQQQDIWVHQRPKISVSGCDSQNPLKTPQGAKAKFPLELSHLRALSEEDLPLAIEYGFTPQADGITPAQTVESMVVSNTKPPPMIREPGFYSLQSVRSKFCTGTVVEPASCQLLNPPRPNVALASEDVADVCAGNPVGLSVDLDLTGTPPFQVRYTILHDGQLQPKTAKFEGSRGHLDLIPMSAGSYVYEFRELIDDVYGPISLKDNGLILTQNVKPAASARFNIYHRQETVCLGSSITAEISLVGEAPWTLDYELVHQGKRDRRSIIVDSDRFELTTEDFHQGGWYSIVLTSITDKSKCKRSLNEEMKFEVRSEQAKAKFGDIDGLYSIVALEGKSISLPIRLQGIQPWTVTLIHSKEGGQNSETTHRLKDRNSVVTVREPGTYQLVGVHDTCPGIVDIDANAFTVSWIDRPNLTVKGGNLSEESNRVFRKPDVCEGEEDQLRLLMTGNAPYEIGYSHQQKPAKGAGFVQNKKISAAIGTATVHMDTSRPGDNEYRFNSISDNLYDHNSKKFNPLLLRQRVNPLPTARFEQPGKTYGYCTNEATGSETIPIVLEGQAPFSIEVGITHHGSQRPEIMKLKVPTNRFDWSFARENLDLGTHSLNIRKVQDSKGCERHVDHDTSSVRILVSDVPAITSLESQTDYCVGEHISFSLSGLPPFEIFYRFQGHNRKAVVSSSHNPTFRRIAEQPGEFTITALSDNASGKCRAEKNITKVIHPMPTVKMSKGRTSIVDIHEGGEAELLFEFTGSPPFEFTYTRSENPSPSKGGKKGGKPVVLETRSEKSWEYEKRIRASDAGVYEVTAIKDRYCSFSKNGAGKGSGSSQKLLQQ